MCALPPRPPLRPLRLFRGLPVSGLGSRQCNGLWEVWQVLGMAYTLWCLVLVIPKYVPILVVFPDILRPLRPPPHVQAMTLNCPKNHRALASMMGPWWVLTSMWMLKTSATTVATTLSGLMERSLLRVAAPTSPTPVIQPTIPYRTVPSPLGPCILRLAASLFRTCQTHWQFNLLVYGPVEY